MQPIVTDNYHCYNWSLVQILIEIISMHFILSLSLKKDTHIYLQRRMFSFSFFLWSQWGKWFLKADNNQQTYDTAYNILN